MTSSDHTGERNKCPLPGEKLRGADKTSRIPIKVEEQPRSQRLRKPPWIKATYGGSTANRLKSVLHRNKLHTVCEEAACPNLGECFSMGTATFLILGDICTRRCPFCDVAHGRPLPPDNNEPDQLAKTVAEMALDYLVITSVNRDDLRDGGAQHFIDCIAAVRDACPDIKIEILVPDFRGRQEKALETLKTSPPDVFNHNLETIERLYKKVRPGAHYRQSLELLQKAHNNTPEVPTKSGLMLGLGEQRHEIVEAMKDLRTHSVEMLTLGQYLQPSRHHLAVERYLAPDEFDSLKEQGLSMGFKKIASAPMVRSSYHAADLME